MLRRGEPAYPPALVPLLGSHAPPSLGVREAGSPSLLAGPTVALFCSGRAPAGIYLAVQDLAQRWRAAGMAVSGGFHSPAEQEALAVLLRPPGRAIVFPARSIETMRLKPAWRAPFAEGRLALVSPFPASLRRATRDSARQRNLVAAALAETVFIAHARPGSATWALAEQVLAWGKPLLTLPHGANEGLVGLGAKVVEAEVSGET
jgi:predicted Rossmann fold nucleotide-binding protein DprA/Smf involved in DNA uptake